jgi:D-sedoheptulose 7-phosphate isomerase
MNKGIAMPFSNDFLRESGIILSRLDADLIDALAAKLADVREAGGRLFILGVGGSAASASHAVNDFRKLCSFEAYCPTDNAAELTARANDEGWDTVFSEWLRGSRLNNKDALLVLSVGGGDYAGNISPNLVKAVDYAIAKGAKIFGIVGRDGGHTARKADVCILIPTVNPTHVTPHTEAFHSVVHHLLVSHPKLKINATKWESVSE